MEAQPRLERLPPAPPRDLAQDLITTEVVDTEHGFDQLRDDWNALSPQLDLPSPFQSWEWHRSWWRHFSDPRRDRLQIVVFRGEGRLLGIAPLKATTRLGMTEITPIGWRDQITEYRVLLFPGGTRSGLLMVLWKWLEGRRWIAVGLPQLGAGEELPAAAQRHLVRSVPIVFETLELPENWMALDRALNQSMRSNVRYYPRLMIREGHPFAFEVARTPDEVTAALPTLWGLHSARASTRSTVRHLDYLKPAARRAFFSEVLPQLAARGEAAVGLLRVHGTIVAAQAWLEAAGVIYLYYSGFDPGWSKYSVAMITTSEIFKDAMARNVHRVEFLRGANHFKSRWGTTARTEFESVFARRRRLIAGREGYFERSRRWGLQLGRWRDRMERILAPKS